jgi:hypothetical protein
MPQAPQYRTTVLRGNKDDDEPPSSSTATVHVTSLLVAMVRVRSQIEGKIWSLDAIQMAKRARLEDLHQNQKIQFRLIHDSTEGTPIQLLAGR